MNIKAITTAALIACTATTSVQAIERHKPHWLTKLQSITILADIAGTFAYCKKANVKLRDGSRVHEIDREAALQVRTMIGFPADITDHPSFPVIVQQTQMRALELGLKDAMRSTPHPDNVEACERLVDEYGPEAKGFWRKMITTTTN